MTTLEHLKKAHEHLKRAIALEDAINSTTDLLLREELIDTQEEEIYLVRNCLSSVSLEY
ncbi:MAG: hypothetical protein WC465_04820 [Patescibacteria group bacterium]